MLCVWAVFCQNISEGSSFHEKQSTLTCLNGVPTFKAVDVAAVIICSQFFEVQLIFAFLPCAASHELQPVDAPLLHLLLADRGLLRPQHVRGGRGGEFPQVSAAPGGGRSQEAGGEEASPAGEKEKE